MGYEINVVDIRPPVMKLQEFIYSLEKEFVGRPIAPYAQKHLNHRIEEYCNNLMCMGEITAEFRDGLVDFLKANLKFS
jgi:hypothetical protein